MWSKVSREKAAGGYPWTHLNHNLQEEVWINPLNLPQDITRYRQIGVSEIFTELSPL